MVSMRGVLALVLALAGCDDIFHLRHVQEIDARPDTTADSLRPEAYYDFEDFVLAEGVLHDRTSRGHDGACAMSQCPALVDGVHGQAGLFSGSQRITIPTFAMAEFTVMFWLRIDDRDVVVCPVNRLYGPNGSDSWQLCLMLGADDTVHAWFWTSDVSAVAEASSLPMPLGSWHQLGIRWNGSTKTIFFERTAVASVATTILFDASPIMLGTDINDGSVVTSPLIGALDDVAIYNRALTELEITMTP